MLGARARALAADQVRDPAAPGKSRHTRRGRRLVGGFATEIPMKHRTRPQNGWVGALLLASGFGVSSLAIAEGNAGGGDESSKAPEATAAARPGASARHRVGYAPDPAPLRSASQWVLTFEYQRGKVRMKESRLVRFRKEVTTPRRIGRYAVELLSGPTIVERLRFDFPLLGADELAGQHRPYNAPPTFESKATITHRVMLPDTSRASRARLVDRATGESFMIPWPPNQVSTAGKPKPKPKPDAGADAAPKDGASDAQPEPDAAKDAGKADAWRRPDVGVRRDATPPDVIPLDAGTR